MAINTNNFILQPIVPLIDILEYMISYRKETQKTQLGPMNLYDINGISQRETYHSNILGYLLNPNSSHNHLEFGNHFLKVLASKAQIEGLSDENIINVCVSKKQIMEDSLTFL